MNATDIGRAVNWMESRWGHQAAWKDWEELWLDFSVYSAGALMQALNEWYRSGQKFAPKPSELLRSVGEVQRRRIERGEDLPLELPCESHVWSDPLPFDDDRHRVCVRCGESGPVERHDHVLVGAGRCVYCPEGS